MNDTRPADRVDVQSAPGVESAATKPVAGLGIAQSLGLGALFFIAHPAIGAIISLARVPHASATTFLVSLVIAWLVVIAVGVRLSRERLAVSAPSARVPGRLWAPVAIGSIGAAIVLPQLARLIPMPAAIVERFQELRDSGTLSWVVAIGGLGPLAEEVFFRGLVLRGLLARYSTRKAVWVSALMFTAFHLNPWQAVVALPMGLAYAWLVIRTGSIWPGVVSHCIVNLFVNFGTYGVLRLSGLSAPEIDVLASIPYPLLLLGVVALAGGLLWARHLVRGETARPTRG
ncbi:MAG: type II CAAX endopeptidase family protein [Candidatus Krumholzibacteriia bacterium]